MICECIGALTALLENLMNRFIIADASKCIGAVPVK